MTSSPAALHVLAHQAQRRARTAEDWWDSPLDTGLAAASAVRHPPTHRQEAQDAVDRLSRWQRDGDARRVSGDIVAIALAASAARDLSDPQPHLDSAAISGVEDLAGRSGVAAPALHVALAAWAMDRVVPDRAASPWPQLRACCERAGNRHGLDAHLLRFAGALSAQRLDATGLVRDLLTVPASPGVNDGAVLLWLLSSALLHCATELAPTDSGLLALTDRRTELVTRLAQEITPSTFDQPAVDDFDPDLDRHDRVLEFLSPMEALLIDISLASADLEAPWLLYEEADALFGAKTAHLKDRLRQLIIQALVSMGLLLGAVVGLGTVQAGVKAAVCVAVGVAVAASVLMCTGAVAIRMKFTLLARTMTGLAGAVMVAGAFTAVNQSRVHPWGGGTEIVVDLILSAIAGTVVGLATRS